MRPGNDLLPRMAMIALLLGSITPPVPGQESPGPTETPAATATEEISPAPTASDNTQISPAPTLTGPHSVRISFLPPPLEGKISLGIYNAKGELVRILHREAPVSEFTVGADALMTKWDGKDDHGTGQPAGKYHARGFLVGGLKIEATTTPPESQPDANAGTSVQMKLMSNPLSKSGGATVDLAAASDDKGVILKTADGLPLITVSQKTNFSRVWLKKNGEKAVDILLDEAGAISQLHVSNADKMMSFDCGDLELK